MSVESKSLPNEKRLILGFDAGCMACSDLAKQIEKAVNEKLEIRSLYDPQMKHWRSQAIGEDAPWAPTLIEIENGKVRAWTGMQMAAHLSFSLGLTGTWRVLRVLGASQAAGGTDESSANSPATSVTRGQLLKGGLAGAVVGVGALSGSSLLTSRADAAEKEPGTALVNQPVSAGASDKQNRAKSIVRASSAYKKLTAEQKRAVGNSGATYENSLDLDQAIVNVYKEYASVVVSSLNSKRSVIATFIVDLSNEVLGNVRTVEVTPVSGGQKAQVVIQENFQDLKKFGRMIFGQDHMIENGNRMSYRQCFNELERVKDKQGLEAEYQLQSFCSNAISLLAGPALGSVNCAFACSAVGLATLSIGGLACGAVCGIIIAVGTRATIECVCNNNQRFCPNFV